MSNLIEFQTAMLEKIDQDLFYKNANDTLSNKELWYKQKHFYQNRGVRKLYTRIV